MEKDDLEEKLGRVYAAIGAIREDNLSNIAPQITKETNRVKILWDFKGGLNAAEISNITHLIIHNIASLKDNLKKWARDNGHDNNNIDDIFNNSMPLKIIHDLWNNDKHGYPPRNGGHSGQSPKLININRVLQAETKPGNGSSVTILFGLNKKTEVSGSGSASIIVTGDIVDLDNKKIGDFYNTAQEALRVWGKFLSDYGLIS